MIINLENGYYYNVPRAPRLLLFGANRTGKTLISKELNSIYDSQENITSLLFDKDIMSSNFISTKENNTYSILPYADERKKIEEDLKAYKEQFNLDIILKRVFEEKTISAYTNFKNIKSMQDNKMDEMLYGIEKSIFNKAYFYTETFDYKSYYELDFIKLCIKKKTGYLRFLDLINKMNEANIFTKIKKMDEIFSGISQEDFKIKEKIIKSNLLVCPICYSNITDENRNKIIADLNKIILDEEIKNSFNYYINLNQTFFEIILSFIENFEKNYTLFINNMDESIMYHIIKNSDINAMQKFNKLVEEFKSLKEKTKKFCIHQESKNSKIYNKIEKEFSTFNEYTKSNFTFEIKNGTLEIKTKDKPVNKLSMSEQKLLQFIYFRILFLQNLELANKKLVVIIDDPFDSYDDIYVYNMVNIIFDLIELYRDKIEKFIVLSHNLNSLKLLKDEYNRKNIEFKFFWLDIFKGENEIRNIEDKFKIMQKLDKNISSFGLPIKLMEKMVDSYSLIVLSSILRENSQFNFYISNKCNRTMKKSLKNHRKYYDVISSAVNHDRYNMCMDNLFKLNKKVYGYNHYISKHKTIREVFDDIPSNYYELELIQKKDNKISTEKDLLNLFVWKYMCVLKIRRTLERKMWIKLGKPKYKVLGDMINMYEVVKKDNLYDFYICHRNLFNAFNHSSTENIPPVLIYHASYIYGALETLEKIVS